jgi:hypothetical protein
MPEITPKTFWEKPEGKSGMIVAAGAILAFILVMMKWGVALVHAAQTCNKRHYFIFCYKFK